jgi:hypothetical protein
MWAILTPLYISGAMIFVLFFIDRMNEFLIYERRSFIMEMGWHIDPVTSRNVMSL